MHATRWKLIPLLLLLTLLLGVSSAHSEMLDDVVTQMEYEQGKMYFNQENYTKAAEHFELARNYEDAKKWLFYCQAIHSVAKNDVPLATLDEAYAMFGLLAAHHFEQAEQWAIYCEGRIYELKKMKTDAADAYSRVLVDNSIDRYLALKNKAALLEPVDTVRQRVNLDNILPNSEAYYQAGDDAWTLDQYAIAADYFCLAGNYEDARQRRCLCLAITMVKKKNIEDAAVIFKLLASLGNEEAAQWYTYCEGRDYESRKMYVDAIEKYKSIFLLDSPTRYLDLCKKYKP